MNEEGITNVYYELSLLEGNKQFMFTFHLVLNPNTMSFSRVYIPM